MWKSDIALPWWTVLRELTVPHYWGSSSTKIFLGPHTSIISFLKSRNDFTCSLNWNQCLSTNPLWIKSSVRLYYRAYDMPCRPFLEICFARKSIKSMLFRKAHRWGLTSKVYNFAEIAADGDKCLVSRILKDSHCLRPLVPKLKTNDRYHLRNNNNNYVRLLIKNVQNINSFIPRNFK